MSGSTKILTRLPIGSLLAQPCLLDEQPHPRPTGNSIGTIMEPTPPKRLRNLAGIGAGGSPHDPEPDHEHPGFASVSTARSQP